MSECPPMWIDFEEETERRAFRHGVRKRWWWILKRPDSRMPFGFSVVSVGSARTKERAEADAREKHEWWQRWYIKQSELQASRIDLP